MGPVSMTSMSSDSVLQLDWESRVQINELEPPSPPIKVWGANKEGDEEYRTGIKSPPHHHSKENSIFIYCNSPHCPWPTVFNRPVLLQILSQTDLEKRVCESLWEVLKKKKIAGGRASDKGQRSWLIIDMSHSHIPLCTTGRLWEMVSNVHPEVILPRGKGPGIFIQQLLCLG